MGNNGNSPFAIRSAMDTTERMQAPISSRHFMGSNGHTPNIPEMQTDIPVNINGGLGPHLHLVRIRSRSKVALARTSNTASTTNRIPAMMSRSRTTPRAMRPNSPET